MIRLLFLVPYPELKEKVDYVLRNYSGKEKVEADIRVWTVEEIPSVPADEYDAMIARGYTAKKMEESYPSVPTIDMPVSGYDIVRALDECQEKYHPKKIVICGFFGKLYEAKDICRMFGMKAEIYSPSDYLELNEMMKEKKIRNCDVLVGGYSATISAKKQGIPSVLVKTGEDTILQAVNEAVRTVVKIRQERLAARCTGPSSIHPKKEYFM
ncbi:PrpR N-terminal domain-containing protein [Clostridium sp. AM58-1XD]|uniref:PrpR N-terminal domain-containing protein n=1 Tax=Clostridium sp. AM58-1XD TaxID=2292307 RepID=UPI001FA872B5|nr:PrpR N-terminal domain-containing protein [Clostridium sp. AM58-1XD]